MKEQIIARLQETALKMDYLYHVTSLTAMLSILKFGAIARMDNFDPAKGYQTMKTGWISFTRSSRYSSAPGATSPEVRFVFDQNKIRSRYKLKPYADRFVVKRVDYGVEKFVDGHEARWEAEEQVLGPVYLKDGLVRLEMLTETYSKMVRILDGWNAKIEFIQDESLPNLEKGLFWHSINKKWESFDNFPRAAKVHTADKLHSQIQTLLGYIKEYESVLKHPKLVQVNSLR